MRVTEFFPSAAVKRSLYVSRPVLNGEDIRTWALAQGFPSTVVPDDLHVTLAYSKEPVAWDSIQPDESEMRIDGGDRLVHGLGEDGATVLRFTDQNLTNRWKALCDAGCYWKFPDYKSHVTFTYSGKDVDFDLVEPYAGPIVLGPEVFSEVKDGWQKTIREMRIDEDVEDRAIKEAREFGFWLRDLYFAEHPDDPDVSGIKDHDYTDMKGKPLRYRLMVDNAFREFLLTNMPRIKAKGWHSSFQSKRGRYWQFDFEPTLTLRVPRQAVFWHVTPSENVDAILKDGLLPRESRHGFSYPQPRVHLIKDEKHARAVVDSLRTRDKGKIQYALLQVDLRRAKGIGLHVDPHLRDVAVYTPNAIPPACIKLVQAVVKGVWEEGVKVPLQEGPAEDANVAAIVDRAYQEISGAIIDSREPLPKMQHDIDGDGKEEYFEWYPVSRLKHKWELEKNPLPEGFPDLGSFIVAFLPDSKKHGGWMTTEKLDHRGWTRIIVLCMTPREFTHTIRGRMIFRHEFVHMLDNIRHKKPVQVPYDSNAPIRDEAWFEKYYSNPLEWNAHFHDLFDSLTSFMNDLRITKDKDNIKDLVVMYGVDKTPQEYLRHSLETSRRMRNFLSILSEPYRRKFYRRFYTLYDAAQKAVASATR